MTSRTYSITTPCAGAHPDLGSEVEACEGPRLQDMSGDTWCAAHRVEWDADADAGLHGGMNWHPLADAEEDDDTRIRALRSEASTAGDDAQVALCNQALEGDPDARRAVLAVLADAEAQDDGCPACAAHWDTL